MELLLQIVIWLILMLSIIFIGVILHILQPFKDAMADAIRLWWEWNQRIIDRMSR